MTGLTFLIMFMFLMTLTAIVPGLLRRLHTPSVVSMMLVGCSKSEFEPVNVQPK